MNPFVRELSNIIGNSEKHCDTESNPQFRQNDSQWNGFRHNVHENMIAGQDRFQEAMETLQVNLT